MPDNIVNEKPSLSAVLKQAFTNLMKEVHTTIPGSIVSFDPELQSAEVQANIRRVYVTKETDGSETQQAVDIPILINVPVIFLRGGGWCMTFPIKPEDECIIHFSERAIDVWRKNAGVQDPKDWRMHNYSDAICQVGLSSEPNVITDFDNENFQVRNEEGDVFISLREDKEIHVATPVKVVVTTPIVEVYAETSVLVDTPETTITGNVTINGDVQVDGNQNIDGDLTVTGTSAAADHLSDGISGKDHVHKIKSGSSAPGPTDKPE